MFDLDIDNIEIEDINLSLEDIIIGMHYRGEEFEPFEMYLNLDFNNGFKIRNVIKTKLPFDLFKELFLDLQNGKTPRKEFHIFGCNSEEDFMLILMCLPVVNTSRVFSGKELNDFESEMLLENKALKIRNVNITCCKGDEKIVYKKFF